MRRVIESKCGGAAVSRWLLCIIRRCRCCYICTMYILSPLSKIGKYCSAGIHSLRGRPEFGSLEIARLPIWEDAMRPRSSVYYLALIHRPYIPLLVVLHVRRWRVLSVPSSLHPTQILTPSIGPRWNAAGGRNSARSCSWAGRVPASLQCAPSSSATTSPRTCGD